MRMRDIVEVTRIDYNMPRKSTRKLRESVILRWYLSVSIERS